MPLGILPKNENRGDEMVEIAAHHHQFVPVEESIEERIIKSTGAVARIPVAIVHPLCMGGDQLTAARMRGARKSKVHEATVTKRLEGLVPVAEDWHTKMNILGVSYLSVNNQYSCSTAFIH